MAETRGGLKPATISQCEESGQQVRKKGSPDAGPVNCMFNPYEYTVKKSTTYSNKAKKNSNIPIMEYEKTNEKVLTLKLFFDTYDEKKDVSQETRKLWDLMKVVESKQRPEPVVFEWGVFEFFGVITDVTQKFTLFLHDGTPVRAEVDVTFKQHLDDTEYRPQNPTSGGGPLERIWLVRGADRLDVISAEVYGDATKWRLIAAHNDIDNPFLLRPGQRLWIPEI